MGDRTYKTSLIFLGIILLGVMVRVVSSKTHLFVSSDPMTQTASTPDACEDADFC